MSKITPLTDAALAELKALHAEAMKYGCISVAHFDFVSDIRNSFPQLVLRLEAAEREREELRADADRYRYIRREAMIVQCTGKKRHNQISWPTIHAADPMEGGNYRDRFDAAVDDQIEAESKVVKDAE